MRAIVVETLSEEIKDIQFKTDVPSPQLKKPGDVLIQVKAAGCNFYDLLMAQGTYQIKQTPPFILGTEFSGIVVNTMGTTPYQKGDRVFGCGFGAYADEIVINCKMIIPMPKNIDFIQAAGLFITYPTSLAALKLRAELQPGETCLIHGATGGVGLAAVQLAKLLGAKVIATGSNDQKLKIAKQQGADEVINLKTLGKKWTDKILQLTDNKGVDVVYDPVGLINESLKSIKFSGRLITVGFASGSHETIATNRILLKNVAVMGLHWGAYTKFDPDQILPIWHQLLKSLGAGQLEPVIYPEVFSLEDTSKAITLLKDRKAYGKVIVTMESNNKILYESKPNSKL